MPVPPAAGIPAKKYPDRQGPWQKRGPKILIQRIPVMRDFWGRPFKRYLDPEALRDSIRWLLTQAETPFIKSVEEINQKRGSLRDLVTTIKVRLFQEGEFSHVFRVSSDLVGEKKIQLAMIVAKDAGRLSHSGMLEQENLKRLYHRNSDYIVRPLVGGFLNVPNPRAKGVKRIYVYFTQWLTRFHELGVHENMHFYINELPFHHFDTHRTDVIKSQILKMLFTLYHPDLREAMEPPKVGAGDFVITRPRPGKPYELKVIGCRRIIKRVTLDDCMRLYLGYYGDWAGHIFHFIPENTFLLKEALIEGLVHQNGFSPEDVFSALKRVSHGLSRQKSFSEKWTPLPALKKVLKAGLDSG